MKEKQSIVYEERMLALRMAAAWTIKKAVRRVLQQRKIRKQKKQEETKAPELKLKERGDLSDEAVEQVLTYARVRGLLPLTKISQINIGRFVNNLAAIQRKSNYL